VRVYGGVFAPSSLLPVNTGYQYRRSTVVMAGGTFVCPAMKISKDKTSKVTWFAAEAGTESVLKLGAAAVEWAGAFTSGEASVVRLQQNDAGRAECLSVTTNLVGSGEIRLEGPALDLSKAICADFVGTITMKSGMLALGASKEFGAGAKVVLDYPTDSRTVKAVTWTSGNPPQGVAFDLSDALKSERYTLSVEADGVTLVSPHGTVLSIQ